MHSSAAERGFNSPRANRLTGMTVARGVLIVDVADETVELSPTDWVQAQTSKILETGTTEGIEVLGSPIVLLTLRGAKTGKLRYPRALRVAREVGGGDLGRLLRSLSGFLRDDARTRSELESRQTWTSSGARLAVAAPWLVLLRLCFQGAGISRYSSAGGGVVMGGVVRWEVAGGVGVVASVAVGGVGGRSGT